MYSNTNGNSHHPHQQKYSSPAARHKSQIFSPSVMDSPVKMLNTASFCPSPRRLSNFFGLRSDDKHFSSVPSFRSLASEPVAAAPPLLSAQEVLRKAMAARVCVITKYGSDIEAQVNQITIIYSNKICLNLFHSDFLDYRFGCEAEQRRIGL